MPIVPPGVSLRRARAADSAALKRFKCRNPNERWTRHVQQEIRRVLADLVRDDDPDTEVIVAEHDIDDIIGVVAFAQGEEDGINIVALAVTHAHRRQGIATALKLSVINIAAARQVDIVWSDVHRQNKPMLALNSKLAVEAAPDPDDTDYMLCVARVEAAP